jgi:hypothetical protein
MDWKNHENFNTWWLLAFAIGGFASRFGRDRASDDALADTLKAVCSMKIIAACIFAIALMLRAAPICAAPVQAGAGTMMAVCEDFPNHHDGKGGQKGDDAARSCHACAFPRVATTDLTQPLRVIAVQNLSASAQSAGGALKPPTPPPRRRGAHFLFNL